MKSRDSITIFVAATVTVALALSFAAHTAASGKVAEITDGQLNPEAGS